MASIWSEMTGKRDFCLCPCCEKELPYWELRRIKKKDSPCLIEICKSCMEDFLRTNPKKNILPFNLDYSEDFISENFFFLATKETYNQLHTFVTRD